VRNPLPNGFYHSWHAWAVSIGSSTNADGIVNWFGFAKERGVRMAIWLWPWGETLGSSFLDPLRIVCYFDSISARLSYHGYRASAWFPYSDPCNDQNSWNKLETETIRQLIEIAVNTRHDLMHMHTHICTENKNMLSL